MARLTPAQQDAVVTMVVWMAIGAVLWLVVCCG